MRKIAVLINHSAGSVAGKVPEEFAAEVREMFAKEGVATSPVLVNGASLNESTRAASNQSFEAVVVGGGDGTLGSAAGVLASTGMPLGVLPIGTYNHFARDLQMPLDIPAAIKAIARGSPHSIDIGEVNGHFFINGSSIGAYPRAVAEREKLRKEKGWTKKVAMVWATLKVLLSRPSVRTILELDGRIALKRHTPFVFIGNNTYSLGARPGELRSTLDSGRLSIYVARCSGFWCLAKLAWKAFRNQLMETEEFDSWTAKEAFLYTRKPRLRVALDGEVLRLRPPLKYRIHPGVLRVIKPNLQ